MGLPERISPSYVGDKTIRLTLSSKTPSPRAFDDVVIDVDYSATEATGGVSKPLIFRAIDPEGRKVVERVLRRVAPIELSFRPLRGGEHLVWLAEATHHRSFGALVVDVAGDAVRG